ncbi:MAG: major tail protein, partial [Bacteroidaceae bacterium]|nr:major tail protein [Bacteroidaceae bacterium]
MAYFGLSKPIIAKLGTDGTYSEGFECGKAVGTDITPNYSESSLYGDNELAEYVKGFTNADVTLTVTTLPSAAAKVIFGHTTETEGETKYGTQDEPNFVGYGFIASESVDGDTVYVGTWLPKVKFYEGATSWTTKGESITFATPQIS